ncbi:MAG: hypothetical protein QM785_04455 [Pyrinomonadaceae bacterium]
MKITRRTFLGAAPVVAAAFTQLSGVATGQTRILPVGLGDRIGDLKFKDFYQNIYTDFMFVNKERDQVPLKLDAVEDARPTEKQKWGEGQENFVLRFSGPPKSALTQGSYVVNHFALGQFVIFITQGGRSRSSAGYLAVINRVTE